MSFSASFIVSQGIPCDRITVIDNSDYSVDGKTNFSNRILQIFKIDGTILPLPSAFSYSNFPSDQIIVAGLDRDFSFRIVLTVTKVVDDTSTTYTVSKIVSTLGYANQFRYGIAQNIEANRALLNKIDFFSRMREYDVEVENVITATIYRDQNGAHSALRRIKNIIDNQTILY